MVGGSSQYSLWHMDAGNRSCSSNVLECTDSGVVIELSGVHES